ncbi:MAG: ubiquinol-cytochrome c reductase iron-sulfur subunit [Actinomycetales bacterium]|nr:ubiquinol-cytochrome c reductase iron-sulfur subunit [Actinomycetales bacterium]
MTPQQRQEPDSGNAPAVPAAGPAPAGEPEPPEGQPVPDRFEDPGLPEHRPRSTDRDPRAARRAEFQVAALFSLSVTGTLLALAAYYTVQVEDDLGVAELLGRLRLSTLLLGIGLFLALFCVGAGVVHWARRLMPGEEWTEHRHVLRGSDTDRAEARRILADGAAESGLGRRPLIRNTLVGALALAPLPAIALLRDTGPLPEDSLSRTFWRAGLHLVRDPEGGRIRPDDLVVGSVVHVMPEGVDEAEHPLEERAKAAVLVIRLDPEDLDQESLGGAHEGIVAYSKICTHMGCPVGLYEQQTRHLLCPCHQSTFDVSRHCQVIFGPAKRPLPQLPLTVDPEGYLVAADGFREAVGPSFWERG